MKRFIAMSILILSFLMVCSLSLSAAIPPAEREALIDLYNSTDGANWTNKTNWLGAAGTENTWYGVTTSGSNTTVVSIDLPENNLVGTIPSSLDNLSNLTWLSLYSNQLTGNIPSSLANLSYLTDLGLHSNQLTGSIPPELGNLSNLQYLNLSSNQLTGNIPKEFGNLSNLIILQLSMNQLTGSIPEELSNLSKLQQLLLYFNQLTGSIPSSLANLNEFTDIGLHSNQLTGNIPPELGHLQDLGSLDLQNNQLTGSIPTELGNLSYLRVLQLNSNQLTGNIPTEIGNLSNLTDLGLDSNQLNGIIPSSLINLTQLDPTKTGFGYNAVYTSDTDLIKFLNTKDPGWALTQTIAPTNVSAVPGSTSVTVSWTPITYVGDNGGYRVFYATVAGGPYTFYAQTENKSQSSQLVSGLTPGTPYYFVVRTRTDAHESNQNVVNSEYSNEATATPGIPAGTITVTSPNGGENWVMGQVPNITWTTTGTIANVNIDYSADNGGNWTSVVSGTANDGSAAWTVPYAVSTQCLVRVSDAANAAVLDASDAAFTIRSDSMEPNDNSGSAAVLPIGTTNLVYDGGSNQNPEWYKFFVPVEAAGQDLRVNVRVTSPYPDPIPEGWRSDLDFELLDGSLRVLGVTVSGADNETLYLHGVASGWYYINIGYCSTEYADSSSYARYAVTLETGTSFGLGYISGRLVDEGGLGVANEFIFLDPLSMDWSISRPYMTSGTDGSFTIAFTPGTYTLLFNNAGKNICANYTYASPNVVGEFYNNKKKVADADHLTFSSGQTLALGDITLDTGAIVSGRVTNLAAVSLASVQVRSFDNDGNSFTYEYVLTDAGGNYTLNSVPAGAKVRFSRNAYATEFYDDQPTLGSADILPTVGGGTINGINAQLGRGGAISGTVADGLGAGIANVRVVLYSVQDSEFSRAFVMSVSGSDNYSFARVPAGDYKIFFDTTGLNYIPEWYSNAASFAEATVVSVSEGGSTPNINAQLQLPSITVTAPNGGESWLAGTSNDITWTSTGTVGSVDILYSTDNGASWPLIVSNTANDGTYEWTVPEAPSAYCLVRVQENDGDPVDQSDAVFTILTSLPSLTLTSPNGGEHWTLGTTQSIAWMATNYSGTVRLVLFKNGIRFGNIASGIAAAAGSYTWTAGQTLDGTATDGSDYRLYLRSTDNTIVDPSDYRFSLVAPAQLQVTSPNGGESWELGSQHAITWNANGYGGTVRLILFRKAGKIGQIVANLPAAQGSYLWTVGSYQGGTAAADILYSIRLLAGDGSQSDYSDGSFAITTGGALVADHLHADLQEVPEEWLEQARLRQRLLIVSAAANDPAALGMKLLGRNPLLGVATGDESAGNAMRLREATWQGRGVLGFELSEWRWNLEKAILESDATVAVVRADEAAVRSGLLNAEGYISVLQELAGRLSGVTLVCSTVSMDEPNEMLERFNRRVREHALQGKGALLDTADIESWRGDDQELNGEVPVRHAAYRDARGIHGEENLGRQGAAMWWLLARLTGWEGAE